MGFVKYWAVLLTFVIGALTIWAIWHTTWIPWPIACLFTVMTLIGVGITQLAAWPLYDSHKEARRYFQKPGTLNLPADYFMPYSVCPECKVEALHWMEEPNMAAVATAICSAKKALDNYTGRCINANKYNWDMPNKPVLTAAEKLAIAITDGAEIIRTCRECSHTWGQKVGHLSEVA